MVQIVPNLCPSRLGGYRQRCCRASSSHSNPRCRQYHSGLRFLHSAIRRRASPLWWVRQGGSDSCKRCDGNHESRPPPGTRAPPGLFSVPVCTRRSPWGYGDLSDRASFLEVPIVLVAPPIGTRWPNSYQSGGSDFRRDRGSRIPGNVGPLGQMLKSRSRSSSTIGNVLPFSLFVSLSAACRRNQPAVSGQPSAFSILDL